MTALRLCGLALVTGTLTLAATAAPAANNPFEVVVDSIMVGSAQTDLPAPPNAMQTPSANGNAAVGGNQSITIGGSRTENIGTAPPSGGMQFESRFHHGHRPSNQPAPMRLRSAGAK